MAVFDPFDQTPKVFDPFEAGAPKAPDTSRTYGEAVKDVAAGVISGLGGAAKFAPQMYGLATGDFSDTGVMHAANKLQQYGEEMKSPGLKAREQAKEEKVKEAEKNGQLSAFLTEFKETAKDPLGLGLNFVAQQLPEQLPALLAAIGTPAASAEVTALRAAAKKAAGTAAEKAAAEAAEKAAVKVGSRAAIGTGALQQGTDVGSEAYKATYDKMIADGVPEPEARDRALKYARTAGAAGAAISLGAQNLPGGHRFAEALAGKAGKAGSRVANAAGLVAGELPSELIEETGGQLAQNIAQQRVDPNATLTEGLGKTAAQAALGTIGTAGAIGALQRPQAATTPTTPPPITPPVNPPVTPPVTPPTTPPVTPPVTPPTPPVNPPATVPQQDLSQHFENYHEGLPEESNTVLQNRDRSTPAAIAQMQGIAANPRYNELSVSRSFGSGAPVVMTDTKLPETHLGSYEMTTASDGTQIPVRYAVVEASSVLPSNSHDGSKNTTYGDMSVQAIRPIAGNGRVAGIQEAYNRDTAQKYKQELLADNAHGIDKSAIEGMAEPMLVRVMPKSFVTPNIADISNVSGISGLSAIDAAKQDAKRVDVNALKFNEDGTPTAKSLSDFINAMPVSEHPDLKNTNGEPTPRAQDRLMNAVFWHAYGHEPLIDLYGATMDPDAKLMLNALARVAPKMAQLDGAGEYDIRKYVTQAAEAVVNAKRRGISLQEMAAQADIGMDPHTQQIIKMVADAGRSGKKIAEGLDRLATAALAEHNRSDVDMFGEVQKRPLEDVFKSLEEEKPEDLFTPPEKPKEEEFFKKRELPPTIAYRALKGKTAVEVANMLVDMAPDSYSRAIMEKVAKRITEMDKRGVPMKMLLNEYGNGKDYLGRVSTLVIRGVSFELEINGDINATFEVLAHEMIHMAANAQIILLGKEHPLVKEMYSLKNLAERQFKKELADGKISGKAAREVKYAFKRQYSKVFGTYYAEFITQGLSNPDTRKFLSTVKVGKTNALVKLAELCRKLLGIDPKYETALDKLLRISTELLESPTYDIASELEKKNIIFGTPTSPAPKAGTVRTAKENVAREGTPAFKKWFGDSKVVDKNGKPLVVYHGTPYGGFAEFNPAKSGTRNTFESARAGIYFSSTPSYAGVMSRSDNETGPAIYPVYLSIQNPLRVFTTELTDAKEVDAMISQAKDGGHDGIIDEMGNFVVFQPNQIKSATGNNGSYSTDSTLITEKNAPSQATGAGRDALDMLGEMGREVTPPPPGFKEKVKGYWDNATDNPTGKSREAWNKFVNIVGTKSFSSDFALNAKIREAVMASTRDISDKVRDMLNISLSQTVHADALGNLFMTMGNLVYDPLMHKWEGIKSKFNFLTLSRQLDMIALEHNMTKQEVELVAHYAFEAKRTASLMRYNNSIAEAPAKIEDLQAKIDALKGKDPATKASKATMQAQIKSLEHLSKQKPKIIHLTDEQVANGLSLFKTIPELNDVVETWNGIRENTKKILVDSGLWSDEEADFMMSNADYVPFFRDDQIENGQGPKEFLTGLMVKAREPGFRGSQKPVHDVFDNMMRWTQYAVNRSVRNTSAVQLVKAAEEVGVAERIPRPSRDANNVRIWRNGKEEFYNMKDPLFVDAFEGLAAISIPTVKFFTKFSNMLRKTVVMNPLFAVSQLPQDAFAAIFSSGLKPQYALRIPVLAVKEFVKTLRHASTTHEELKRYGATGVKDFSSHASRMDAMIYSGLKSPPGGWNKVKSMLEHISMASDNAVRQAVYEATMSQYEKNPETKDIAKSLALEKAFEVINFRRRGSSKALMLAGQVIPFFNAYLAAQNVAYKTITGIGISPGERKAALETLIATTGSVMALSLIYAMMNGDDDDYLKKPTTVRDRLLMIPGSGGLSIPLRNDLFTIPKVITEHMYLLMTDNATEDGRKFRQSLLSALSSSIMAPTAVPQAIKPFVEVYLNYDFFQQKPLIGTGLANKETERQFNESTSELGKILGKTGLIAPINADHLMRGMFGSVGGVTLLLTNQVMHSDPTVERPTMSWNDVAASIPGASGFITKENQNGLKKDFYMLKEEVDKTAATLNDIKQRSPHQAAEYANKEENKARLGMYKQIDKVGKNLTKIRQNIALITNMPDSKMSADEKDRRKKALQAQEDLIIKSLNLKNLRQKAQIGDFL